MDKLQRAKMAGVVSVLADIEKDPVRKSQLIKLMNNLQANTKLTPDDAALLEEIEYFATPFV